MRRIILHSVLSCALLGPGMASAGAADTIVLKNGRRITAAAVYDDGKSVTYSTTGGEFTLPKSMVKEILKGPEPGPRKGEAIISSPSLMDDLGLALPPNSTPKRNGASGDAPITNGQIDFDYLAKVDRAYLSERSSATELRFVETYREVTHFYLEQRDLKKAGEHAQHAASLLPDNLPLAIDLGLVLVRRGRYTAAVAHLRPSAGKFPDSSEIFTLLGSAYYFTGKVAEAIKSWKQSLDLEDNRKVRTAMEKAIRERDAQQAYGQAASGHFLIRFEGPEMARLGREILQALETHYNSLVRDLRFSPQETIIVILYPDRTYTDVTRTPSWTGAINDGKIRIPVSGLVSVTGELDRVLKHELTHSFIQQITQGRCPVWLNEGVAQLEEGASTAANGRRLGQAFAEGRHIPLRMLEGSFRALSPNDAALAYAESLAATEYIRSTYGFSKIVTILERIPSSGSFAETLKSMLRVNYAEFENAVAKFVVKRYGT